MLYLPPGDVVQALTADYMMAELCRAGLHGFAAENEARMEAMAAARGQIERQLAALQAAQRRVRQTPSSGREGQGPRPWTKLGPSRLGRAAHDGPRPHFICSETSIGSEPVGRIHGTARMVQKTPAAQR